MRLITFWGLHTFTFTPCKKWSSLPRAGKAGLKTKIWILSIFLPLPPRLFRGDGTPSFGWQDLNYNRSRSRFWWMTPSQKTLWDRSHQLLPDDLIPFFFFSKTLSRLLLGKSWGYWLVENCSLVCNIYDLPPPCILPHPFSKGIGKIFGVGGCGKSSKILQLQKK